MRMKDGTSIKEKPGFFDDLETKMKIVDLNVDEEHMAMMFLCSLSKGYTSFTNSFMFARDTLIIEDVKGIPSDNLRDRMREMVKVEEEVVVNAYLLKEEEKRRRIRILRGVPNLESLVIII